MSNSYNPRRTHQAYTEPVSQIKKDARVVVSLNLVVYIIIVFLMAVVIIQMLPKQKKPDFFIVSLEKYKFDKVAEYLELYYTIDGIPYRLVFYNGKNCILFITHMKSIYKFSQQTLLEELKNGTETTQSR